MSRLFLKRWHPCWSCCIAVTGYKRNGGSNHRQIDCVINNLFTLKSKDISKLHITSILSAGPLVNGEFFSQSDSNARNISIAWRHHDMRSRVILNHVTTLRWKWTSLHKSLILIYSDTCNIAKNNQPEAQRWMFVKPCSARNIKRALSPIQDIRGMQDQMKIFVILYWTGSQVTRLSTWSERDWGMGT